MALTPKQDRNGIPSPGAGHNTAVPGPGSDVAALMSQAQDAGMRYAGYGHTIFVGETAQTSDLTLGNTWEWDDGLAVAEQAGEP